MSGGVEIAGVARIGFEGERDNLVAALGYVRKGIGSRMSVPILAGVLIVADEGGAVTVTTYNYDEQRTVRLDGTSVTAPGRVLLTCHELYNLVNALPKGTRKVPAPSVKFAGNGGTVTIMSGDALFNLDTLPIEDYPALPPATAVRGTMDAATMADGIARIAVAHGKDAVQPILTGVRFIGRADGTISLDATDRYRLGSVDTTWTPAGGEVDAIVPGKALREAGSLIGKAGGPVTIGTGTGVNGGNALSLSWGDGSHYLILNTLDGEFPKIRNLYPDVSAYAGIGTVSAAALLPVVKTIGVTLERAVPLRLTFDGSGTVTVASAKGSQPVPATYTGDPITIAFNHSYLTDGLKAAGGIVQFGLVSAKKPAILRQVDGNGVPVDQVRYLLMPVRIEGESDAPAPAPAPAAPAPAPAPVAEPEPADEISAEIAREIAVRDAAVQDAEPEPTPEPAAVDAVPDPLRPHPFTPKAPGSVHCVAPCHYADDMPIHQVAATPAPVVEDTTPEPEPADDGAVPVARIAEILRTGEWSSDVVRLGKGKTRKPVGVDVLKLNAGKLERPEYEAVADVLRRNGCGAWNRDAAGFIFETPQVVWGGGYTRSGSESLAAWLDRNAPAVVDAEPEPVPVAEPEPEPEPEPAPVVVGQSLTRSDGTVGQVAAVERFRGALGGDDVTGVTYDDGTGERHLTRDVPALVVESEPEPVNVPDGEDTGSATITAIVPAKRGPLTIVLKVDRDEDSGVWAVTNTKGVRFTAPKAWRPLGWSWNGTTAWEREDNGEATVTVAAELADALTAAGVPSTVPAPQPAPVKVPATAVTPAGWRYDPAAPADLPFDQEAGRHMAEWAFLADDKASLKATAQEMRTLLNALVTRPVNKGRGAPGERDASDAPINYLKVSVFRDNAARTLKVRAFMPKDGAELDLAALRETTIAVALDVPGVAALAA